VSACAWARALSRWTTLLLSPIAVAIIALP
jgi:hypothetical protein